MGRKIPFDVKVVSVESDAENLVAPNKPGVLLFTSKSTVSLLFRAVSFAFRKNVDFIQIKDSDLDAVSGGDVNLLSAFNVKSVPSMGLLREGAYTPYEGDLKSFTDVVSWISKTTGLTSAASYIDTSSPSDGGNAGAAESAPVEFVTAADVNALFREGSQNTDETESAYVLGVSSDGTVGEWWSQLVPKCMGAVRCVQLKCDHR